ncbi:MAG: tRNA uridine-5-carboxymethylaminomethyl(34) synthesis enzyme MnmG [Chloroflexi bacterium]|nr:tRNA uridine-5-carboxymethylaminomethyl(34) synthesis enzyme MnmG [Chloroflexota bacterium]
MYDVAVVGGGHAGCEAALAAARMGCKTLLLTMNLDTVALMPCNPSIGGPAKGHLVREIDALGGEMARNIDRTFIQIRMLNTGKGPAVQALRAQADKRLYSLCMRRVIESQPNLDAKQDLVESMEVGRSPDGRAMLVLSTNTGRAFEVRAAVLTTGTFLAGRIIVGDKTQEAGRAGEFPAAGLSVSLRALGFELGRLKTGTPPRVDARTIDFDKTEVQPGSDEPLYFSFASSRLSRERGHAAIRWGFAGPPNPVYPHFSPDAWRPQLPCYLVHTNGSTHEIIRASLHRAPLFSGLIQGVGPRYCPSIEDKVVRFADKASHSLFLEPEGWDTNEVYVQGANTSLPEDVQLAMLRSIPALERAEITRVGYAVEYDYVPPSQTLANLESKLIPGLFFAGQINGTSGYEEAAAQGLVAGINAALRVLGRQPLILRRDQSYIGVMIDDLVTREISEPYRLLTSRAEYRLLLRQDNADLRLSPTGHELGLVDGEKLDEVEAKRRQIGEAIALLRSVYYNPGDRFAERAADLGMNPIGRTMTAAEVLRRTEMTYEDLPRLDRRLPVLDAEIAEQVEIEAKYEGYIDRQSAAVARVRKLEERRIPAEMDYDSIPAFRKEARDKLKAFRPATLGQASRLSGVNPSDIAILLVHLERGRRVDGRG